MKLKNIELWKDRHDVMLTAFLGVNDSMAQGNKKRPAVIVVPGGAYYNCDTAGLEGDPVALSFAADGYQAFTLRYSTVPRTPEGKKAFPSQLLDLGKAMLMIREKADEWDVDTDRICVAGFSAGAHLTALYSSMWQEGLLSEELGAPAEDFRPAAVMLLYGYYDYRTAYGKYSAPEEFPPLLKMQAPLLGAEVPDEETMDRWSPYRHVTASMPPAFLAAAMDDRLISPENSLMLAARLHQENVPCELHIFRRGGHAFGAGLNMDQPYRRDKRRGAADWLPLAKEFLNGVLYPETAEERERDVFAERYNG